MAREMFEKLGYMLQENYDRYTLRYIRPVEGYGVKVVEFDLMDMVYSTVSIPTNSDTTTAFFIYPELHQAIHQQMKELGQIE